MAFSASRLNCRAVSRDSTQDCSVDEDGQAVACSNDAAGTAVTEADPISDPKNVHNRLQYSRACVSIQRNSRRGGVVDGARLSHLNGVVSLKAVW